MSLLLDALERADKARRPLAGAELGLEPRDGEPTVPAGGSEMPPQALKALFDLQGAPRRPRRWLPWLLLAGALAAAAAVISLWLLLGAPATPDVPHPLALAGAATRPAAPNPANPANPAGSASPLTRPAPGPAASTTGVTAPAPHPVAPVRRIGRDTLLGAPAAAPAASAATPASPSTVAGASRAAGAAGAAGPTTVPAADVRLFRTPARQQVDPALLAAWTALRQGRSSEARDTYLRLEKTLPDNVDVQLGLATLAADQGQQDEARARYQRVLVQDPLNPSAQAGLALLAPAGGNTALDSQLRNRAAGDDGSARFALAARLSSAGQWPEAEQAWFDALQGDPDNPDTLYNLAVALDHLHQSSAASQHYRSALQAAGRRHARFDRSAVEQRLRALDEH